jgi:hypothetical protein
VAEVVTVDVAPANAYLPAGHVSAPVHEEDFKPVVDPYVPAGQSAQVELFVMDEFVAPASAYRPIAHVTFPEQAADVNADEFPNVPAGQSRHSDPVKAEDAWYVPGVQFVQVVPESKYNPGLHELSWPKTRSNRDRTRIVRTSDILRLANNELRLVTPIEIIKIGDIKF